MPSTHEINPADTQRLQQFLGAPQRPEGTMSYCELAGFLFAVSCSPEMVSPSEWLPIVFGDQDANYAGIDEAQAVLGSLMAMYNAINQGVIDGGVELPSSCQPREHAESNLEADAPLSQWAQGFLSGHDWLEDVWNAYAPAEVEEEFDSMLLVLTFFASRKLAQEYFDELLDDMADLGEAATTMLEVLPDAMQNYASLGRSIYLAVLEDEAQPPQPATSAKVGRNEPCPCGSGKKYKHCCGATLH